VLFAVVIAPALKEALGGFRRRRRLRSVRRDRDDGLLIPLNTDVLGYRRDRRP
jgi:hypothetical protein